MNRTKRIGGRVAMLLSCGVAVWMLGCVHKAYVPCPPDVTDDPFFEEWAVPGGTMTMAEERVRPIIDGGMDVQPGISDAGDESLRETDIGTVSTDIAIISVGEEHALPTGIVQNLDLGGATDVAVILRSLAKVGNQNMMVSPNVQGSISFTFNNVPWDQAFNGVLASAGLTYQWEGDIIRVMTIEDMRKELEIEKTIHERKALEAAMRQVEPLVLRVIRVRYMGAKKLSEMLQRLMGQDLTAGAPSPSRQSVTVDEDNNALIVQAIQRDADRISKLVAELDKPKPQVRIDAQIVEANSNTARQLGVQWGGFYSAAQSGRLLTASPGADRNFNADFPAVLDNSVGFTLGFLSQDFGMGEILDVQLSALQEDGKVNILSSPSITTLDNETATIESGEERAYRESTGTGSDLNVSVEWKRAVLKLEVTPHIIDGSKLRIRISANKDSFDETRPETTGEFPVSTKNATTTVVLRDGQTTVIGGLAEKTKSGSESGIPFLKSIPLLGRLFKGTRDGASLDEVLIFITPHILGTVVEPSDSKNAVEQVEAQS